MGHSDEVDTLNAYMHLSIGDIKEEITWVFGYDKRTIHLPCHVPNKCLIIIVILGDDI